MTRDPWPSQGDTMTATDRIDRDLLATLEALDASRCLLLADRGSGLRAAIVIDDVTLGPAAGGVRTRAYPSLADAVRDAAALARAMTIKCALGGLSAGGAKAVVLDHAGLDRARAFEVLGRRVEELGGLFRTAGDLGTTARDLEAMARTTRFVHADEGPLADAVARGLVRCVEACAEVAGRGGVRGLRIAVQGAGAIGAAAARALAREGASLFLADLDEERAEALAAEVGGQRVAPDAILAANVDVVAPCAVGGVLDEAAAELLRAWAVCGAANNILTGPAVARMLADRGVLHVPDTIASAGAVIDGIGRTVMGLSDRTPLLDRLGETAGRVLREAASSGRTPDEVALDLARQRLEEARRGGDRAAGEPSGGIPRRVR